jgi:hypothetical protein
MGGKQLGFSDYELTSAKKQTKREKFLSEMEVVVPWQSLIDLIEPHYPKVNKKGGRPPYPLGTIAPQHRLGVGILGRLPPALHLLREQAPLAAVGAELGGVERRALQYNRELDGSAPALWFLLR